jgi:hypothetical protein
MKRLDIQRRKLLALESREELRKELDHEPSAREALRRMELKDRILVGRWALQQTDQADRIRTVRAILQNDRGRNPLRFQGYPTKSLEEETARRHGQLADVREGPAPPVEPRDRDRSPRRAGLARPASAPLWLVGGRQRDDLLPSYEPVP